MKLIFGINGYAIGSILCFSGLIIVVYKIAFEVFERIEIANIAAIITTLYPFFNFYAITILTEPIYILLLYISLYFAIRFIKTKKIKFALFFSIFFALDSLVRFANLSMFVFFVILFLFFTKEKLKTTFFMIISFCLIMSFWWIRNYFVFNEFVATAVGESGKIFYAGNNPSNKSGGGTKDEVDFSKFNHIKDIKLKDEAMKKAALNWIKQNPLQWIKLEFIKLKRFFSPFFFAKQFNKWYYNLISLLSYGVVFVLFLYGIFSLKKYFYLYSPMLLYAILLTGVHLVFIVSMRYRLPIEPFMIIIASGVIFKGFGLDKSN